MPNVKLFVDADLWTSHGAAIRDQLLPMRDLLCATLKVPLAACQIAAIPVSGPPDQPLLNLELLVLPRPERTRDSLTALGQDLRALISSATGGAPMAIRFAALDPDTYVALK